MSDEISIENLDSVIAQVNLVGNQLEQALQYGVNAVAQAVYKTAFTGLTSVQNNTKKGHIGSPGGFPNRRTGALSRSLRVEQTKLGFGNYEATIQPGTVYAQRLETGAGWSVNYPYMRPSADYVSNQARQIFLSAVNLRWN
jgi:hypothetical protein